MLKSPIHFVLAESSKNIVINQTNSTNIVVPSAVVTYAFRIFVSIANDLTTHHMQTRYMHNDKNGNNQQSIWSIQYTKYIDICE